MRSLILYVLLLTVSLWCYICYAQFDESTIKCLTGSGAVTTNNKAGILQKVIVSGEKAGDQVIVKDGTATRFVIIVPSGNESVVWDAPEGQGSLFMTDIDCILSASGNVFATFQYREQS